MDKERISPGQFFSLIFLFEIGTAVVLPIGFAARQTVWLSILLALIGGILLFLVYDYLYRQYPELPLSEYAQRILGKYMGWTLSLTYIPVFIYIAARDLREAGDLLVTASYDQTPILAIMALMILTVVYVLHKGVEVLARMAEIYLIMLIGIGVLGNIFILLSGIFEVKNLLPVLGDGWKPILEAAYPEIYIFPFGEMICFTMILPFLNQPHRGRKTGIKALMASGIILSFTHAMEIAVLGEDMYNRSAFPLFVAISEVNIMDFLQRLDAIVIITLIIGVFFKLSIYCYAALIVASSLFNVDKQKLLWPIAICVLISSLMISSNLAEHFAEGKPILHIILPIFSTGIPLLLLMVHLIRKRFGL
ncbi:GerAB/ArcD/ProY family transporter [Ammoniphilus sp. YIM 78166]|uniref:GerAB/ArcD/ProY family transporter n=1 Tax=Ammoniphilus sp. YIM 78166 TaxID=1644106 RepID=UPI0010703D83|nr:GerAB/ArcD/ProY family transporter [Ammoniphilus sp. YIM 78166]